jgi:hypothetical protein
MRSVILLAFALALPATALHAQAMPVSQFLAKADALQKKGPLALFSSDIKKLKGEVQASGQALRNEQLAMQKAGRKPPYCIPPKAELNSKEILDHFRSIPVAQRGMPVKMAFLGLVKRKYPCPA